MKWAFSSRQWFRFHFLCEPFRPPWTRRLTPLSSAEGFSDPSLVSSRTSVANKPVKSNESYVSNNIQKQIVRDQQQKDTEKSTRQTSPASYELIK